MRVLAVTATTAYPWQEASTVVSIIGVLLGVIAAVAFAMMYFRGSYAKATIETLKQNNDALIERVDLLDDRANECAARADVLERENEMLKRMVTGADAIKTLQEAVSHMAGAISASHHETLSMATEILRDVEHLHQHVHGKDGEDSHAPYQS